MMYGTGWYSKGKDGGPRWQIRKRYGLRIRKRTVRKAETWLIIKERGQEFQFPQSKFPPEGPWLGLKELSKQKFATPGALRWGTFGGGGVRMNARGRPSSKTARVEGGKTKRRFTRENDRRASRGERTQKILHTRTRASKGTRAQAPSWACRCARVIGNGRENEALD